MSRIKVEDCPFKTGDAEEGEQGTALFLPVPAYLCLRDFVLAPPDRKRKTLLS